MRKKQLILGLLLISTFMALLVLPSGCFRREATQPDEETPEQPPGQNLSAKQFIGSEECANCHKQIHEDWKDTFHNLSLQQADWDKFELKGDFSVGKLSYGAMEEGGGEIVDIVLNEDGTVNIGDKQYEIFGTYGGWDNWKERYFTKDVSDEVNDDAIQILPIQWNQKPEEWVPYHADEGHGEPNKKNWWRPERSFEKNCSGCHNTGLALEWNDEGLVTAYQYSEFNTGCENCHGPGSLHQNNPPGNIINPAELDKKPANEVCGQCHSRGKSKPDHLFGFPWDENEGENGAYKVGDNLDDYYTDGGGYYGEDRDGDSAITTQEAVASKKHHQQWPDHKVSAHYTSEANNLPSTCFDCHSPHDDGYKVGDKKYSLEDVKKNVLCLDCHKKNAPFNGEKHHFGDSEYATMANTSCTSCHMTRTSKSAVLDEKGLGDIHSHRLNVYPPSFSTRFDMPNSCVECHDNATDEQVEEIGDIVEQRNNQ